ERCVEQSSDNAYEDRRQDRERQRRTEEEVCGANRCREGERRSIGGEHLCVHQKFDTTSLKTRPMDDWSDASYEAARVASAIRCRTFLSKSAPYPMVNTRIPFSRVAVWSA